MKKGFTLIELLVVISIMSILTVITVGQFNTARKKARDVARKGDLNSVSKALQTYFADYGKFPTATADGQITDAPWGGEFKDSTGYIYMKVVPRENFSSASIPVYCYVVTPDLKSFGLFAQLENTADSDCKGPYLHCGGKSYCYSMVSTNTTPDALNGL